MKHTILFFAIGWLSVMGCASTDDSADLSGSQSSSLVELVVSNQSQFQLHHVFVYPPYKHYKDTDVTSLIATPLPIGNRTTTKVTPGSYMVTVTRLKNKDSSLLAYTTRFSFEVSHATLVECFDDSFRRKLLESVNASGTSAWVQNALE